MIIMLAIITMLLSRFFCLHINHLQIVNYSKNS
ncbi:uncharacterized protein METZ01_LOCUS391920, partial [marine metagenome]